MIANRNGIVALPSLCLKQLDGAMLVVDFQSMRLQESGADQASFARTDEHLSRSFSSSVEQVGPKMFAVLQRVRF